MKSRIVLRTMILAGIILGLVAFLRTGPTGQLSGTVKDQFSGKPLCNIRLKLIGSGLSTATDSSGYFEIKNIPAGQYDLECRLDHYQTLVIEDLTVEANQQTSITASLATIKQSASDKKTIAAKDIIQSMDDIKKLEGQKLDAKLLEEIDGISDLSGVGEQAPIEKSGTRTNRGYGSGRAGKGVMSIAGGGNYQVLNPPNGQKYWDMYHTDYGTNPFIDTEDDNLSTFGADVSTGSYSLVRNYLTHGEVPPKDAVRVEEFVNYFKETYPAPDGKTFAVYVESAPSPVSKNCQLVKIGIKGKEIKSENRKTALLTFVVDVSGSMNIENRLGLVKKTLNLLTNELKSGDKVGIVTYGSQAQVVLEPTGDKEKIESAVNGLYSEGSTNAEAGLWKGYQLASQNFNSESINRVILCTDGVANNGETSSQGLLSQIEKYKNKGITLTACGFGMGNYNDVLIEQLATKGDGTYYYIDDVNEAKRVFVEQLTGTLQVIAKDVKIQVEFDKNRVSRYRLIGYEKRDVKDEDFRNDKVDGGEIGSGHTVTALYEVKLKNADDKNIGEISIRYKSPDGKNVSEIEETMALNRSENPLFEFLSAVVLYSEIMRESYWTKHRDLAEVKTMLESLDSGFRKQFAQYEDFYDMVRMTLKLKKSEQVGTAQIAPEE